MIQADCYYPLIFINSKNCVRSRAFRNPLDAPQNPILCVGCSWTLGHKSHGLIENNLTDLKVPYEVWPEAMAKKTSHPVVNGGIPAAGTYLHYKFRLNDYINLQPRMVIFQVMDYRRNPNLLLSEKDFQAHSALVKESEYLNEYEKLPEPFGKIQSEELVFDDGWLGARKVVFDKYPLINKLPKFMHKKMMLQDWEYIKSFRNHFDCPFLFWMSDNGMTYPYHHVKLFQEKATPLGSVKILKHIKLDRTNHPLESEHIRIGRLLASFVNEV